MKAILKRVEIKECKAKNGVKFDILKFEVQVINDNKEVKVYKGSMGVDYAKKYAAYCNTKFSEQVGNNVEVTLVQEEYEVKETNEKRIATRVKYLNFLDEKGNKIILPSDNTKTLDF